MKYTIITAIYNGRKYIERLASSIFTQTYPDIEWVVQDGGSTDGTLELLEKFKNKIRLASEPDNGVYDAWNKAVTRATGDWALFLGADDALLHQNVIVQCHRHMLQIPPLVQFAYGALVWGRDGDVEKLYNPSLRHSYHEFLNNMGIPFPSTFIRVPLLKQEKFDDTYKIAGDFDFAARLVTKKNLARIPVVVTYMERGGVSGNQRNPSLLQERLRVLYRRVRPKAEEFMMGCAEHIMNEDEYFLEPMPGN